MARASRWENRNARARTLGYKNYYDYRAHGYGATPPKAPRATGERLAALRGHRSAAGLNRLSRSGRVELVKVNPGARDPKTGQWSTAEVTLTLDDGSERTFRLRGSQLERFRMRRLYLDLDRGGATVLDSPSLDLFQRFQ